jgi:hypothetical protein
VIARNVADDTGIGISQSVSPRTVAVADAICTIGQKTVRECSVITTFGHREMPLHVRAIRIASGHLIKAVKYCEFAANQDPFDAQIGQPNSIARYVVSSVIVFYAVWFNLRNMGNLQQITTMPSCKIFTVS